MLGRIVLGTQSPGPGAPLGAKWIEGVAGSRSPRTCPGTLDACAMHWTGRKMGNGGRDRQDPMEDTAWNWWEE